MDNTSTIRYTLKKESFEYHFKKQMMIAKGCVISAKVHPIFEVEQLKNDLKNGGLLYAVDSGYKLKKNFAVGPLMALNLCSDKKELSLESIKQDIVINSGDSSDDDIRSYFDIKNIVASDSCFAKGLYRHELKFEKLETITADKFLFEREQGKSFSNIEQFVVEVLDKANIIKDYRRGDDSLHEADIVCGSRQIEIVNCFNAANNVVRFKKHDVSASMVIDLVDTDHFKIPVGVIKKFTSKNYTNALSLELVMLMIGSNQTSRKMLRMLETELEKAVLKNNFQKIHFVIVDPAKDIITVISSGEERRIKLVDISIKLYKKQRADFGTIDSENRYLLSCKNIFTNDEVLVLESGEMIERFIKETAINVY